MFCQNCGHKLSAEGNFCAACGTVISRVAVENPCEKPVTFEDFMVSCGRETSRSRVSGATLDAQFQAAKRAKKKERSAHFKSKGQKKADETVKVCTSINTVLRDCRLDFCGSLESPFFLPEFRLLADIVTHLRDEAEECFRRRLS